MKSPLRCVFVGERKRPRGRLGPPTLQVWVTLSTASHALFWVTKELRPFLSSVKLYRRGRGAGRLGVVTLTHGELRSVTDSSNAAAERSVVDVGGSATIRGPHEGLWIHSP